MLVSSVVLAVAFVAQNAFGGPVKARSAYAIKESHFVPSKWTRGERAVAERMLHLQIGVKQANFDTLERHLLEGTLTFFFL